MRVWMVIVGLVISVLLMPSNGFCADENIPAAAQVQESAPTGYIPYYSLAILGAVVGAGLTVIGGARAIGEIGGRAVESIARQPEVSGKILTTLIIASAMIEGVTLFGLLICLLVVIK